MKTSKCFIICAVTFALFATGSKAQFNLKDKIKNKTTQKVDQKENSEIDKGLNKTEKGIEGIFKKKKTESSDSKKDSSATKKEKADTKTSTETKQAPVETQSLKSFSKYDFIPGEQTMYFEDFSQDNIGDFPDKWNTNSSGEVVSLNNFPGKWFYMKGGGTFYPEALTKFPENFTLEFDIISSYQDEVGCLELDFINTKPEEHMDGLVPGVGGFGLQFNKGHFNLSNWKDGNRGEIDQSINMPVLENKDKLMKISIWVHKSRFRLYFEGKKLYDVPKCVPPDVVFDRLRFYMWGCEMEGSSIYIGNVRLAAAAPDMRSKLITEGKLVTHGIHFDSGSDKIKPESYGTIKEIANTLKDNPTVKIKIIGHTDNDGVEKLNMELSKKRALAVKNALSSEFAIDASRMETDGKGMSQPISPNSNTEGKANNRRVEFIKL